MSKHEIRVTQLSERFSGQNPVSTIWFVYVKPPITTGELFETVILGRDGHGVKVAHVITTAEETVIWAGSSLESTRQRERAIYTVVDRISRLVNTSEKLVKLVDENPFPRPLTR